MKERERLMKAYVAGRHTKTELADAFGISRKTLDKWVHRFTQLGLQGLSDRPRSAHHHPNATPQAVRDAVVRAKLTHPTWGPLKLSPDPNEPPEVIQDWPSPSTRGLILARAGLTRPRRSRRRVPPATRPFGACDEPNSTWCADFKGWFRTRDGRRCDPLTVSDAYSRMLLRCEALERPDFPHTRNAFEALFREYGLPDAIRTDNGPPFASVAVGGLSPLAVWWVKLAIRPERIEPGHPEQNGRHERMHLTLKQECCMPPAATWQEQQQLFDVFRQTYNHQRPHQALGLKPPASLYRPSYRPYPSLLEDPVYPPHAAIRRVRTNGEIKWRGRRIFISEALRSETVGLLETETGYAVYFGPILLGVVNVAGERLVRHLGAFPGVGV